MFLYIIWMLFVFFFFLFAANSLIRSWWYREAYIKPWQPNSPDTSQSGKIFLFICLVIQTVYTSFRTSKYNVAVNIGVRDQFCLGWAEVSCPNIFSIACHKIKWFCPNITWFFCPNMAISKILGGGLQPPAPRPLYAYGCKRCFKHYLNVIWVFFLFAANSLIRRRWYREAHIKPWQPISPDTSQSGKIFLFIYLVIQTVYTSFWATKYDIAVKDFLNIIWMLFVFIFLLSVCSQQSRPKLVIPRSIHQAMAANLPWHLTEW